MTGINSRHVNTSTKDSFQLSVMLTELVSENKNITVLLFLLHRIPILSSQRPLVTPSASDWRCGGAHYEATRDTGQHPNNLWVAETQGQPYCQASRHSHTPGLDNNERKGNHYDVKLKMTDAPTRDSILPHSNNSELRTFRIASNTPCAPFYGEDKSSLLPRTVRRRIHQLRKRLQQALHYSTFNIINCQRQLKRRRECMQRRSCLRSKISQCFTSEKSDPNLSPAHLQRAVRSTMSPYKNTTMAATGTNPISHSWQSHKFASTPTTENTDRHNNIECTLEPDSLPQINAKLRLHEYDSHLTSPRGEDQTHLLTKPQSTTSLSNGSRGKSITSLMSPRVTLTVPSDSDFKPSKEEGNRRTGSMRQLDDQIRDPVINIHGKVEINVVQDEKIGYPDGQGKDPRSGKVSRANEPMVSISQRREGHGDQYHQYHSYFGNNSPATTKANFLCYRCTMKPSSIRESPKRYSATSWIHINIFFKPHVSQETHQRRDLDSPYHFVSPSILRNSSIGSSLAATGNWNTTSPVRLPGKRFCGIHRGIRRMKRQRRTPQKSQHIRTVRDSCQLTIRINTESIPNAELVRAIEETDQTQIECRLYGPHLNGHKLPTVPSTTDWKYCVFELYCRTRKSCRHPKYRRVHGEVANRCFVIPQESSANIPVDIRPLTMHRGLFDKQSINQETHQLRPFDSPQVLVSEHFVLHCTNISSFLRVVRKAKLARRVWNPQNGLYIVGRGNQIMEQTGRTKCRLHSPSLAGHGIDFEKATASSTINQKCRSYHWRDFNCCHPKYRRVRREVEAQGYSMTSPGRSIKVEVNIKSQTTRRNLFFKQHISRETYQQQDCDSPYHFVSLSALRISNIGSSLTAVRNRNTISPVRIPRERFYRVHRRIQG